MEHTKILWAQLKVTRLDHPQYNSLWSFGITYRNGYPRITIYKVVEGNSTVAITLPMKATELTYIAMSIEDVTNGHTSEVSLDFRNNVYVDGVRSDKIETNGSMRIFKENDKVVLEMKFLHADTDTRIMALEVPPKENAVTFRFPIANDAYFGNVNPTRYANAYASMLSNINAAYCAALANRESSSR